MYLLRDSILLEERRNGKRKTKKRKEKREKRKEKREKRKKPSSLRRYDSYNIQKLGYATSKY